MKRCYVCNSPDPEHEVKGLDLPVTLHLCDKHHKMLREYTKKEGFESASPKVKRQLGKTNRVREYYNNKVKEFLAMERVRYHNNLHDAMEERR